VKRGPIAKFIDKRGEGLHHVAFEVDDITAEIQRLESEGFIAINKPKSGADNKLICFLHPKNTHGVLVELCQSIK
jgi:methylmalonyl-CoA/ethylmalonyl-CoA epimerase